MFETVEQLVARRSAEETARRQQARDNFKRERPELGSI